VRGRVPARKDAGRTMLDLARIQIRLHGRHVMEPWIATVSGGWVDLDQPSPRQINVQDIAKALSQICRWCGHTPWPYSVAQHSVLVDDECQAVEASPRLAVLALLHNAYVAYLGDVTRPLGRLLGDSYIDLRAQMQTAILDALGIEPPTPAEVAAVRAADEQILRAEAHLFFPGQAGTRDWPIAMVEGRPPRIAFETPAESERLFLRAYTHSVRDTRYAVHAAVGG
jgi:hypothetical protein